MSGAVSEPLTLTAGDSCELAATLYPARVNEIGRLIVAGATATPQGYYRRFAEHAASRGFTVLTFDYRGIGRSRPAELKGYAASMLDWARLDLAAAVEHLARNARKGVDGDTLPLFLVGHSFGGHALGLLPNHARIARCYTFASGAGWHGWMPRPERWRVRLAWSVVLPALVRWKGYSPMSLLGMGEDLPLDVYRQWKRWCGFPNFFLGDPDFPELAAACAEVRTPIVAATALDDRWATPHSCDVFMRGFTRAPLIRVDIDPRALGGGIGHMGYFRPAAQPLWDAALDWFQQHPSESKEAA